MRVEINEEVQGEIARRLKENERKVNIGLAVTNSQKNKLLAMRQQHAPKLMLPIFEANVGKDSNDVIQVLWQRLLVTDSIASQTSLVTYLREQFDELCCFAELTDSGAIILVFCLMLPDGTDLSDLIQGGTNLQVVERNKTGSVKEMTDYSGFLFLSALRHLEHQLVN